MGSSPNYAMLFFASSLVDLELICISNMKSTDAKQEHNIDQEV